MTDTDTRAALDAAIHSIRTTESILSARTAIAILVADEVSMRLAAAPTVKDAIGALESDAFKHGKCPGTPRGLDLAAAREFKRAALDRAITAHVEAEVARRLAVAPSVEESIDILINGMTLMDAVKETRKRRVVLRDAIAADRERAIRDHNATWQAHDLERDAEVARWQGEAHTLVRAIKSIAAAVGAPEVPSGDGWGERVAAVVIGAIAADRERAANEAERSGYARGRRPFNGAREKPDAPARPTPDEARRLVESILMAVDMHSREQRAGAVERILLRALGVEA